MKPKKQNRFLPYALATTIATLLNVQFAHAATYYWDQNGTTTGFGTAGGTWNTTGSSTWNATAAGTTGPIVSTTTLATSPTADAVNFGTGTTGGGLAAGTITVGTVSAGNITFGSLSGAITLSGGAITLAAADTITVNNTSDTIGSNLSGSATTLTKAGAGTLYLSGTNTYAGTTTISNGVLVANSAGAISGGLAKGGTGAGISINGGILGLGNGDFYRVVNGSTSAAGQIAFTNNGGFAAYGADRVVNFNGANSTTSGGIVGVGTTSTAVSGSMNGKNLILGATDATHKVTVLNTLDFGAATRTIQANDGAAAVDGEISGILQPQSAGTAGLIKTGTGTLALSGANTLNGPISIQNGQLNVATIADSVSSNLGIGTSVIIGNAATSGILNYTGTGSTTATRVVTIGANSGTPAAGDTGGATIQNNGTNGGTGLKFTAANFNATGLTGSLAPSRTLTLGGSNTDANTIQGVIADGLSGTMATALTKAGAGSWTLSGASTFTGNITVSAGTLIGAGATNSPGVSVFGSRVNTRTITVNNGGTLQFNSGNILGSSHTATTAPTLVINSGGVVTNGTPATNNALNDVQLTSGTLTSSTGHTSSSSPFAPVYGAWNLNGTVTSTGSSTISTSDPTKGWVMLKVVGDKTTNFNVTSGTLTVSAPVVDNPTDSNIGSLSKSGAGSMILSAANTYTGATSVSAGTLTVSSTGSLHNTAIATTGTGTFLVAPGSGTVNLGNTGTVGAGASLNIASGTNFSMVDGISGGTTNLVQEGTFAGNALTLDGAILNFELGGASADKLAVTGAASLTGTNSINILPVGSLAAGTYNLITASSGLNTGSLVFGGTGTTTQTIAMGTTAYALTLNNSAGVESVTVGSPTTITGITWTGQVNGNGTADSSWNIAASANWAAGSAASAYTNGTAVSFGDTNAANGGAPISNGTVTIAAGGVTPTSISVNNSAVNYTLSGGAIGGTGGISKSGTGSLTLSTANTFSGGLSVAAGTVTLSSSTAAGSGTINLNTGGATNAAVQFTNSLTVANAINVASGSLGSNTLSNVGSNTVTLNGNIAVALGTTLTLDNSSTSSSFALELGSGALVSGAGSVATTGTSGGNIVFRGANTFSGGFTLGGSSVIVPGAGSTGPAGSPTDGPFGTGTVTLGTGSMRSTTLSDTTIGNTVTLAGDLTAITSGSEKSLIFSGPATLTGTRTLTSNVGNTVAGKSLTFSGNIGDGGSGYGITKAGTGSLVLSGSNTYTGVTTVNAGALTITNANSLGTTAGNTVVNSGGEVFIGTSNIIVPEPFSIAGTGVTGAIHIGGSATGVELSGAVSLSGDATLQGDGSTAITYSGGINTAGNALTFGGSGTTTVTTSGISGTGGSIVKNTGGTLNLNVANTFTGSTTINAGIVQLGHANALQNTSGITMATGSTLRTNLTNAAVTVSAPITTSGNVTINAPTTSTGLQTWNEFVLNGAIGGTGNVTFSNVVNANTILTVTLNAASSYSGTTTIDNTAGTAGQMFVKLGVNDALPTTTVLNILGQAGTGTGRGIGLNLSGFNQTLAGLTNTAATSRVQSVVNSDASAPATLTINGSTNTTFSGILGRVDAAFSVNAAAIPGSTNGNNFGLVKSGTGTFTVTGNNSYVRGTTLNQGTLTVGTGGTLGATTGSLTVNNSNTTAAGTDAILNLAVAADTTVGSLSGATAIPLSGTNTATINTQSTRNFTVNQTSAGSFDGVIAGPGNFTLGSLSTNILTLSGTPTFTGTTAVNAGTLRLDYSINDTSKLSDTAALILSGGTLDLSGGTHAETVLSTTLTAGTVSRVTSSTPGAVLQMNVITQGAGASIDFGASGIATTDTLNNGFGILGSWATIGGADFAINSTNAADGLITTAAYTDLTRLSSGAKVIADGPSTNVRLTEGTGTAGDITLAAATTTINTLLQSNSGGTSAATIDSGTQTLLTNAILVGTGAGALTIGNGTLEAATAGGDLALINNTASGFTINSVIADNTTASSLSKSGNGSVTLSATNTYTGATNLSAGTLNLTGSLTGGGSITVSGTGALNESSLGVISGASSLTHSSTGTSTLSGSNTYSAGTSLSAGILQLGNANALGSGALTLSGGSLDSTVVDLVNANNNAQTWNGGFGFVGTQNLDLGTGAVTLGSNTQISVTARTLKVGGNITGGASGLTKAGAGTLTLSGTNAYTGNTTVTGGTLNITGSLTGNTTSSTLALGTAAANTVVNVSNDMTLYAMTGANVAGSAAAYNQTAGNVNVSISGVGSSGSFVSNIGYGYFNLTGGIFKSNGSFSIGCNNAASNAVAYVGGTGFLDWSGSGNQTVGYASAASLTVGPGGTVSRGISANVTWLATNSGSSAILNVAGGSLDLGTAGSLNVNNTASGGTSVTFNVAAGTLTMGKVLTTNGSSSGSLYANYAGGTLKASATLATSPMNVMTSVSTVFGAIDNDGTSQDFAGGMTVDTDGFSMPYGNALRGAAGNGVKQSNLTITGGSGYIGAPLVQFTGGTLTPNGTPASGYAVISGGAVTGIVITSPGTYTVDPTVTLTGGGGTGASVALSALSANAADNGLTKIGAGTLTLGGANTYIGNTTVNSGTLALADNAQLKFVLGATSGSNNSISGAGTVTLDGDFVIDTSAADALSSGTWTLENVSSLTGAYGSTFTVVGFTDAGGDKWTKVNGSKLYTFDETTGVLTLASASAYDSWALAKGLTGLPGSSTDPAKTADPDGDGRNNLYEFAFDGNPLSGATDGKVVGKIGTVSSNQVMTLTLPVRTGASFSANSGDQLSALIDGIYYRVEGAVDLVTFTDTITEVTGGDATTIQTGLPTLSTGWTYRTFRAPGTVPTVTTTFLRAKISETP